VSGGTCPLVREQNECVTLFGSREKNWAVAFCELLGPIPAFLDVTLGEGILLGVQGLTSIAGFISNPFIFILVFDPKFFSKVLNVGI